MAASGGARVRRLADARVYARSTLAAQDGVTPVANASAALAGGVRTTELPTCSWTAAVP